ncbi:FAD-dependent monooxygenase [Cyanobacterium aponinum UTEX 3222]|uniref:FAD-dependent monooxygenase n=1 Tax=Cyanobacterium aponinum TaxID=379064 RepID=UPI002B4C1EDB|nr:FAD-dependent monooxygenase [Cyanobacterium aponinum]WRL40030.1 FAD-dependent monooxygenase [Cyanobacterium aponinum UTEX 3221]WRL42920.1 FAD-dependent monooxygenase [Cyanobacterium aponinum UTEX 3222]
MEKEIIIVGGGIGGLTLARALQLKGIDFQLYEQAKSFEALGYGLQISPNVVRVFQQLGLDKELETISHRCYGFQLKSFDSDREIASWQLNQTIPYYQSRRADLHQLLYDSIEDKSRIHFCQRLTDYHQEEESLYFSLENDPQKYSAKALIGADGVRSHLRKSLFPNYEAKYSGYFAFRAILPFSEKYRPLWGKATVWMGKNHHVVAYPNENKQIGKCWLNLVLVVREKNWQEEGWAITADKQEIWQRFGNKSPLLDEILQDLGKTEETCYKWGLFTHQPLPYWSKGKVTLLGDAAHPMLPFQAQGAGMAIEDAYVLANCLSLETKIETALFKYQQLRQERATKVQQTSRKNADIFHATGISAIARDIALGLAVTVNSNLINLKTAWIYDYDVTNPRLDK